MSHARWIKVVLVALVALLGAACDLPEQVVGSGCETVGALGRDATHLLRCGDDLTWQATITLDRAALILTRLTANQPTPASPAPLEPTSGCAISRRYALDAADLPPAERKYRAIVTTVSSGRSGCGCVIAREWSIGMEPEAVESLRAAMDAKEAQAVANYARFGVGAEAVPVEARTIFVRTAWRSSSEQRCLRRALGSIAEEPGKSFHERGVAIDIEDWEPAFRDLDRNILRAHGWCRTYRAEGWHYEYRPVLESWGEGSRCID